MRELDKIAENLFEKVRDRFEDVSLGDENAKATNDPEAARFFNFDYTVDGENHGNITLSLIDETSLKIYFSKNISDDLDEEQKHKWYAFLRELREFAKRNLLSFEPRDITRSTLKHRDIAQQSKADSTYSKDEVIGESKLYGTSKSSYEKFGPARIIVRHSQPVVDEATGARSRHINSVYVENHEGERFKMPFKSLTGARAMARHVSAGGVPHDDLGKHICEMAQECSKLKPFMNNVRRRTFEDAETQQMVEAAFEYHGLLNNTLKRMSGKKGYTHCKEQFEASHTSYLPEDEANLDEMKERFIKRVFNDKMTDALPLVHKAYKMKKDNKFTEQFENWATAISEGTWAFPETDEDKAKLMDLLSQELPVGVDAQNATNALYDIFGDDGLFDALQELAEVDPQADARDTVMDHLADINPTLYQSILDSMGDQDTPEPADDGQEVAESEDDLYVTCIIDYDQSGQAIVRRTKPISREQAEDILDNAKAKDNFTNKLYKTIYPASAGKLDAEEIMQTYPDLGKETNEGNTYGSGDGGMDGVVYEERDIDDNEQVCVYCGEPRDDKLGCCDENHWETKKEFDNNMNEDKEDCKYCGGDCPNDEEHACDGYLGDIDDLYKDEVKEDEEDDGGFEAIQSAIIRRIAHSHHELLMKLGPDGVLEAAREVAEFAAPVEEIGSSDISGWVRRIEQDAGIEQEHSDLHEAFELALREDSTDISDKLQSFVGQTFYIPKEGQKGTVSQVADPKRFSNSLVVDLASGTTTAVHFTDLKPIAETPGPITQLWQKLKAAITGGADPKFQPKYNAPVSDINTPQQFQKLAGLK